MQRLVSVLSLLPSALFLLFLFFFPMCVLAYRGFSIPFDVPWVQTVRLLQITVLQAVASSVVAGVIGTFFAFFYSESKSSLRTLIWNFSLLCFSLPAVLISLSLIGFWGQFGISFTGWGAIVVAHALLNFPLFVRLVGNRLLALDRSLEKTALSLGANRMKVWLWVTWPRVRTAFLGAFVLSLLYCATSFVILLLLGGGPKYMTLEVAIYQSIRGELDLGLAAFYALLQSLLFGVVFFKFPVERPILVAPTGSNESDPLFWPRSKTAKWILKLVAVILVFSLTVAPLFHLTLKGVLSFSNADWIEILSSLGDSLLLAFMVGAVSIGFVFPLVRWQALKNTKPNRVWDFLAFAPAASSPLVISLAWWLAYPEVLRERAGGLAAVVFVQTLFAYPLVYRSLVDGYRSRGSMLVVTARNLGANSRQCFFWIELPVLRRAFTLSFLFGALFSLGEVTSLIIFSPPDFQTLTWYLYRSMARYDFASANAAAVVLVAVMGAFITILELIERAYGTRRS